MGKKDTKMDPNLDPDKTMGAMVWNKAFNVEYVQKPKPLCRDPKDVLVRVTATSICGSDLHMYSGNMPCMQSGDIMGHEFMGIIEEKGADVHDLQIGQRVVVAFNIICGKCSFCKRGEFTACKETNPSTLEEKMLGHRTSAIFGYSHLTGGVMGGQAEYVRVPFAEYNCLPIPNEVTDEQALYLSDVIPTAYFGTEMGEVKEGDSVAIWGLGPIGLMVAKWCQIRGASRVIGIDSVTERIDKAKTLGITTINHNEVDDVYQEITKWYPDGIDVGIECVGFEYPKTFRHKLERAVGMETDTSDILTEIIRSVRGFGHVAVLGVYTGTCNQFPIGALMEKGLTLRGGQSPTQRYWKMALDLIVNGELDPTFIITHRSTLDKAPELYDNFYKKEEGIIKVFLQPLSGLSV
jgi:threonine dehydrogenase-like Zn-dependent dehydrogenase